MFLMPMVLYAVGLLSQCSKTDTSRLPQAYKEHCQQRFHSDVWDSEGRRYGPTRPISGAPPLPLKCRHSRDRRVHCLCLVERSPSRLRTLEEILPWAAVRHGEIDDGPSLVSQLIYLRKAAGRTVFPSHGLVSRATASQEEPAGHENACELEWFLHISDAYNLITVCNCHDFVKSILTSAYTGPAIIPFSGDIRTARHR